MKRLWIPLYIADYLKDTSHLRALESGAYLHLIMAYWVSGGALPNDDKQLATIAKMTDKQWKESKLTLARFFGPDFSSHKRIDAELKRASDVSAKRKQAAAQKWCKHDANAYAQPDTVNSSQSTKKEKDRGAAAPAAERKSRRRPSVALPEGFSLSEEYKDYARKQGLSDFEIQVEFGKFCTHARAKDRRLSDWSAGWQNWVINALKYSGKSPPQKTNLNAYSARPGSAEFQAWRTWARDNNKQAFIRVLDQREMEGRAFTFETQWPQGVAA